MCGFGSRECLLRCPRCSNLLSPVQQLLLSYWLASIYRPSIVIHLMPNFHWIHGAPPSFQFSVRCVRVGKLTLTVNRTLLKGERYDPISSPCVRVMRMQRRRIIANEPCNRPTYLPSPFRTAASDRRGNTLKGFTNFYLKAMTRICVYIKSRRRVDGVPGTGGTRDRRPCASAPSTPLTSPLTAVDRTWNK